MVAHWVRPGHVVEAVRVDWVRQDVVVVHRAQTALQLVRLCEHQRFEVLLVVDSFQTHSISHDSLFAEPELTVLILEHGEEMTQILDSGQIFDSHLIIVFPTAASAEQTDDNHENDADDVANERRAWRDMLEPLLKLVPLQRVEQEVCDFRHQVSEHLLV